MAEKVGDRERHRIVTTCLIVRRNRFLIKKRRPDREPFPGRWETVGGGLDPEKDYLPFPPNSPDGWDDVLERVIRRETRDEVGLEIGRLRLLGDSVFIRQHDRVPVLVLRYVAFYKHGRVVLDDEAIDYRWIEASEIDHYNLIGSIAADIRHVTLMLQKKRARPAHV